MFLLVTGQYRRRCVHIGRAAACALALGCVSGAPFAQSDEGQIEKVVFAAGALFDFDAYQLRPEGRAALDDFLGRLKGTTLGMIRAVGHAHRLGSEGYNQILSGDREWCPSACRGSQIGRAHVWTPVTSASRMPS